MSDHSSGTEGVTVAPRRRLAFVFFVAVTVLYGVLQLGALGHPLLWQDEGETAMFGRRILDYGFPKVHGPEGVVYGMSIPLAVGTDPERDAYRGSLWGQYYVAAIGVAWSEASDDLNEKTARVRFPFVLAGLVGLASLLWAFRKELRARSGTALPSAAVFMLLLCFSTSLQLHLREARYYGLVVGGVGIAVALQRSLLDRPGGFGMWVRSAALATCLIGLLNIFYPAALALMGWLLLETVLIAWDSSASVSGRRQRIGAFAAPVMLAALAGVLLAVAFDVAGVAQALSTRWPLGPGLYLENLGHLLVFLLRWEFLGLVIVLELWLAWLGRSRLESNSDRRPGFALLRLAAWMAFLGAFNPVFFERYFVAIGPLLAMVFVLEGEVLLGDWAGRDRPTRGQTRIAVWFIALIALLSLGLRSAEFMGRMREVLSPVSGPVDYAVATIQAEEMEPNRLLIATNYEAEPLMFYLGSRVVGRFEPRPDDGVTENAETPDWVIPRRGQPKRLEAVRGYLLRGSYEPRRLPIADMPYNALPELYSGRVLQQTHWFETPLPGEGRPPLIVYRQPRPSARE